MHPFFVVFVVVVRLPVGEWVAPVPVTSVFCDVVADVTTWLSLSLFKPNVLPVIHLVLAQYTRMIIAGTSRCGPGLMDILVHPLLAGGSTLGISQLYARQR